MELSRTSFLVAPLLILLIFASTLVGIDRLGFRDVSHFYTPLYDYVAWRTSQQWLPLWNPLDQTGMPLVGETTTAVAYPVRYALFHLPIATETAISWYVVLHLILASATATTAARWAGSSHLGSAAAGIVYPLSGSILFLYTNPPFLVAAAWLPLVLGALLARLAISARARIVIAGTSMSMMILGGDPQTALHAMMVVTVVWVVQFVRRREAGNVPVRAVLATPILAAALAAPQIAASVSWSSQSDRIGQQEQGHWLDPPLAGGKRDEAYQYSLPPWHTLELATPNALGDLLPVNRRISRLAPGDGRTWTPSIYMGTLVALVLLCRIATWRSMDAWMAIAMASGWLAMGGFGLVWLIQTTTGLMADVDSAVGGPYWWLYEFLPGYDSFRYPAKWLTLFALSSAIVTAQWLDQPEGRKIFLRITWGFATLSLLALIAVCILRWNPGLAFDPAGRLPRDEFWGPLDIDGALKQIGYSLVHSLLAVIAIAMITRFGSLHQPRIKLLLLAVLAIDIGVGGYGLIARVGRQSEQELVARLDGATMDADARWMRTQTGGGWPAAWKESKDDARLVDVEASLRAAWFGRWHLSDRAAVLNNMVSIQSRTATRFWTATRQVTAGMSATERDQFWASIRRWLSIGGVVHTTERSVSIPIDGRTAKLVERIKQAGPQQPTLRVHSDWTYDVSSDSTAMAFANRLREIMRSAGSAVPVVGWSENFQVRPGSQDANATIDVIANQPEYLEAEVRTEAAVLLTRGVYQDGHWIAQYVPASDAKSDLWKGAPVHRVDGLAQGVLLPAGDWKLRFRYAPWWLGWSLAVAAIAWISVLGSFIGIVGFRRTRWTAPRL